MAHVATVTIDHTKVSANLTDYVVYIDLANLPSSFWDVVANGGGDIRCFKADGTTELAREVVACDTATDTGELHVKYTGTLSSTVDTVIQIHADGTSSDYSVSATYGRNAVWSDYIIVMHLASNTTNSTGVGTTITGSSVSYDTTSKFGTGLTANGTSHYVTWGDLTSYFSGSEAYATAWVKLANATPGGANQTGLWTFDTGSDETHYPYTDGTAYIQTFSNTRYSFTPSATVDRATWHKVSVRTKNETAGWKFYQNDEEVHSENGLSSVYISSTRSRILGAYAGASSPLVKLEGDFDEFRLANFAPSGDFITTEYRNQNSPSTFYDVSSVPPLMVKTGTYVGNGATTGTRAITGVGFRPKVVIVWSDSTSYSGPFYIQDNKLADSGEDKGYFGENGWGGASATEDTFASIDADGFTISCGSTYNYLNYNGSNMYYLALGGTDVVTGKYTGNNTDNRSITGVGFQPVWVFVMGGNQHQVMKFNSSGASTDTSSLTYNAANITDGIQALEADGFQVGTNSFVNSSSYTYYYFAVKSGPNVYQSEYTGNNTDNRGITGIGFLPEFVFIKGEGTQNFAIRTNDHGSDLTKYYRSTGLVANYIQSFDSDGFTIGNAGDVNTSSEVFGFIAFREPVLSSIAQHSFRFRNDDGGETTATWDRPLNVDTIHRIGEQKRLRILLDTTGDTGSTQYKLQYKKVGNTVWKDVT